MWGQELCFLQNLEHDWRLAILYSIEVHRIAFHFFLCIPRSSSVPLAQGFLFWLLHYSFLVCFEGDFKKMHSYISYWFLPSFPRSSAANRDRFPFVVCVLFSLWFPPKERVTNRTGKHELCQQSKTPAEQQLEADKGLCNFAMDCARPKIFLTVTPSLPKRAWPFNLVEKRRIILYCCFWEWQNKICDWNLCHKKMLSVDDHIKQRMIKITTKAPKIYMGFTICKTVLHTL